jgi:hypothetical protein
MSEGRAKTKAPAEPDSTSPPPDASDVVLLGPPTDDGAGVHVLRARDTRLEAGELRMLEEGRPITGEVVTLAPRKANPRICDVKESFRPPRPEAEAQATPTSKDAAGARGKKGPAQVATKAYRDHWEETFASRSRSDADLN